MIRKKFYGDLDTCTKWYKQYFPLIPNFNLGEGEKKTFIKEDKIKGKNVTVFIQIRYISPDYNFLVAILDNSGTGNLCSGLSINELNDTTFKQFYPRDGSGFQNFSKLYRTEDINTHSNLPYFSKYNGKLVNQNHYINGRQYTGSMAEQVQYMLGTTNIDIGYCNLWIQSNGFYQDSQGNYWLITIKDNTSNNSLAYNHGVYARKVVMSNYTDAVITKVNNQTTTVNYSIADAIGYTDGDKLLLSMQGFYSTNPSGWYSSYPLSFNQGWAFNKKGNKIVNTSYKYGKSWTYVITITETITDGVISLNASQEVIENLTYTLDNTLSIFSAMYSNYSNYSLEEVSNLNYSQVKYNPLGKLNPSTIGGSISYGTGKIPLQVYYDEQDKLKTIYYSTNKVDTLIDNESTTGFTQDSDFINNTVFANWTFLGDFKRGVLSDNDYKRQKSTLTRGIIINNNGIDNNDLLVNDCDEGVRTYYKEVSISSGSIQTDFSYKVENHTTPIDLTPYRDFQLSYLQDNFNDKVNLFNTYRDSFYQSYFNTTNQQTDTDPNTLINYLINQDYVLDEQFKNMNDMLQNLNTDLSLSSTFKVIDTVHTLVEILTLDTLNIKGIDLSYLLYELDSNVKANIFDKYTNTYMSSIWSSLDDLNTLIQTYLGYTYISYYQSLRVNYKNLITAFRNAKDKSTLNVSLVNSYIDDLNTNHIPVINTMIDALNTNINSINSAISSLNSVYTDVDYYNELVESFLENIKGYQGVYLESSQRGEVAIGVNNKDHYYLGRKIYAIKRVEKQSYFDKKLNNYSISYNNGNRNSINVFKEQETYGELIENNGDNYFIDICQSNEYCLYKQNNNNGVLGDFQPVETFTNYKAFTFTDYQGFDVNFNAGDNIYFKNNNISFSEYTFSYYLGINLISDFDTISKSSTPYYLSKMSGSYFNDSDDNPVIERKIITIEKEIINQDVSFNLPKYGQPYFNMFRDSNSFNYVLSKDLYSQNDTKLLLTNISKYTIMNINHVNFIGLAFDKE